MGKKKGALIQGTARQPVSQSTSHVDLLVRPAPCCPHTKGDVGLNHDYSKKRTKTKERKMRGLPSLWEMIGHPVNCRPLKSRREECNVGDDLMLLSLKDGEYARL